MSFAFLDTPHASTPPVRDDRGVARDITYTHSARTPAGRAVIRSIEAMTGRAQMIRRVTGYETEVAQGRDFWRVMMDRFAIRLDVVRGSLGAIPAEGPLVVVANHPYGILDGLILGHILSGVRRGDFRILAHNAFVQAESVSRFILPIDFSGDRAAQAANIRTRAEAIGFLRRGGAVGVFPGGTVSTAPRPFGQPMDPVWRGFTARMIQKSGATVVPIWFDGANSRLFQVSSHLSYTLRMALLVREFRARIDTPVRLAIGAPIPAHEIESHAGDAKQMMDFLRRATYDLSPKALDATRLGYEFEARYKT